MLRHAACVVVLLVSLLLSGCAYFQAMGPDVPQRIDELVEARQYGKALDILSYSDPGKENYGRLMEQQAEVLRLAKALEKSTLRETQQLMRDDEWYKAAQLFDQSLHCLPDSAKLQKNHQVFLLSRETLLNHLELKLDINRARWLIANGPVQLEMIRVLPDAEAVFPELKDFRAQKERTADHLLKFTLESLGLGDHRSAAEMIGLIDDLAVDNLDEELLVMCRYRLQEQQKEQQAKDALQQRQVAKQERQQERLRQKKEKKKTQALIHLLKTDASMESVQKGWRHLQLLEKNKQAYPASFDLYRALEQEYQHGIRLHSQIGRKLYSQGKIHEALRVWQSLLDMDTNNQKIQDYVDRANRVLRKLKQLEKQAEADQDPSNSP